MSTSELDGSTAAPKDISMETSASNGQVGVQESSPMTTDGHLTTSHPNDTEISSATVSESANAPGEQNVSKEHKATSHGVSAEKQNGNVECLTEVAAQFVAAEPAAASEDVTLEPIETVTKVSGEDILTKSEVTDQIAEPVTTEPITADKEASMEQDVASKPEVADQEITSAPDVIPEPCTATVDISLEHEETITKVAAQVNIAEPVTASEDVENEPMAEDVTTEPVEGDGDITVEREAAAAHGVTCVSEVGTQDVAAKEPSPAIHGVCTNPVAVPQEITKELVAIDQDATSTMHDVLGVTTEPGVGVQSATAMQSVTTEPVTSAQSITMKPDAVVQDVPKEFAPTIEQYATTKSSTLEPQKPQGVPPSDEATSALEAIVKPVTLPQDASTEPNTAQSVTSVTAPETQNLSSVEVQNVTTQPVTTGYHVTLDAKSVPKEPRSASPDVTDPKATEQCGDSEQEVSAKSVPAAEDVNMDTTEADQGVALRATVTADSGTVPTESTAEHVPMELDAASEELTTDPAGSVQDVAMESQDGSKEVVPDVTMEPISEIQDSSDDLQVNTQGTGLKADVTDQVMGPAENGTTCESKLVASDGIDKAVPANKVSAVQTTVSTKDATSDVNKSTVVEVEHTGVQDDLDQSYAIAQEDSDPSKAVAQAAVEDGTEPNKGVLSFYSTPAQEAFFSEIQNAKFFSIMCEQQIEIEGHTYIPVGVCYLEKQKTPCEDVLAYVPLDQDIDVFVDSLAAALSEKWGLNLAFCRGQSLLTIGAAGAQVRAAASLLSQRYPYAVRTFSSSMSLNTWLAKSCVISEIADSYTWVERMLQWVTEDEEKRATLHKTVTSLFQQDAAKHSDLTDRLSRSQWERSHDTLDLTVELLEAIMLSLNDIKENHEVQSERTQASDFLIILQNFEFILTLVIMKNVLGPTKSLSQSLQGQPLDVYRAVNSLPEVISSLSEMKTNIDAYLQNWYQEAVVFAAKLQINVDHSSQECLIIYCRDIISRGAIDHSICEITELFSDCALSAVRCLQVVPYVMSEMEGCCMDSDFFKVYRDDFPDSGCLQAELLKWREKWLDADPAQQPLPAGVLDTLSATDAESFPNIEKLLRLLMVLPCFRREDLIRQGKKSLLEFNQQRSLLELYPL